MTRFAPEVRRLLQGEEAEGAKAVWPGKNNFTLSPVPGELLDEQHMLCQVLLDHSEVQNMESEAPRKVEGTRM